jgi:hypothetical protein
LSGFYPVCFAAANNRLACRMSAESTVHNHTGKTELLAGPPHTIKVTKMADQWVLTELLKLCRINQ